MRVGFASMSRYSRLRLWIPSSCSIKPPYRLATRLKSARIASLEFKPGDDDGQSRSRPWAESEVHRLEGISDEAQHSCAAVRHRCDAGQYQRHGRAHKGGR